jgi:NADPH:quinone reductase-like Zn-dependent oxidoreductase
MKSLAIRVCAPTYAERDTPGLKGDVMTMESLELRTHIAASGELTLSLESVTIDPPAPDEVILRMEAAPLNPSDLGLMFGPADLSTLRRGGAANHPTLIATIHEKHLKQVEKRIGQSLQIGNEGAGTVIAAGDGAEHLIGKKAAAIGGAMFAQYRKLQVRNIVLLPDDASVADGASMFVNPLTALGFVETMRAEGHGALAHRCGLEPWADAGEDLSCRRSSAGQHRPKRGAGRPVAQHRCDACNRQQRPGL